MFMKPTYERWLELLKECNGYYEQEDKNYYYNCWVIGLTPRCVADYLNNSEIPM